MKNSLKVLKTTLGEIVFAQVVDMVDSFQLVVPFLVEVEDECVISYPFLPGSDQTTFNVPKNYIITLGEADEFYVKTYGSMLYRKTCQEFIKNTKYDGDPKRFDEFVEKSLAHKKAEILKNFGMLDDPIQCAPKNTLLH